MVPAGVFLVVLLAFAVLNVFLWADKARQVRAEQAFWRQLDSRPELYDWAKEPDL